MSTELFIRKDSVTADRTAIDKVPFTPLGPVVLLAEPVVRESDCEKLLSVPALVSDKTRLTDSEARAVLLFGIALTDMLKEGTL